MSDLPLTGHEPYVNLKDGDLHPDLIEASETNEKHADSVNVSETAKTPEQQAEGPIMIGGQQFIDEDSALAYLTSLSQPASAPALVPQAQPAPAVQQTSYQPSAEPDSDPAVLNQQYRQLVQYVNTTLNDIKRTVQDTAKESAVQKFWTEFYSGNPDLKNYEIVVNGVVDKYRDKIGQIRNPIHIKQFVAQSARTQLKRLGVLQSNGSSRKMVSSMAPAQIPQSKEASASGQGNQQPKQEEQPKNLFEQIKDYQRGMKQRWAKK